MDLGIADRIALVAASSRGIGYASALALAREGARVMVSSRDVEAAARAAASIIEETGGVAASCAADVTDPKSLELLVEQTEQELGPIDILVTNSGAPRGGRLDELGDEDWIHGFELATLSVARLLRLALPGMRERGWGRVVAVQSTSVKQPIPHLHLSNGVRPGAQGLLKSAADMAGADGVTVNSVLPGVVRTQRFLNDLNPDQPAEEQIAGIVSRIPTGRIAEPEDIAAAVAFLASRQALHINGVALLVDGGTVRSIS